MTMHTPNVLTCRDPDGREVHLDIDLGQGEPTIVILRHTGTRLRVDLATLSTRHLEGTRLTLGPHLFEVDPEAARAFLGRVEQIERTNRLRPPAAPGSPSNFVHGPRVTAAFATATDRSRWTRVEGLATAVEILAYIVMALGVLGAVALAWQRDPLCDDRFAQCSFVERYPLFGFATGLLFVVVLNGLVIVMVAAYIRARASDAVAGRR